jgi:hypothetical protein
MSIISKVIASGVGVAFLALTGCASQGSGAATPANLPSNCKVISSCKGVAQCKAAHSCKHKKYSEEKG